MLTKEEIQFLQNQDVMQLNETEYDPDVGLYFITPWKFENDAL